ncbi:MAG TPA: hypothetical protein DFS52_15145, partial [Myxococcales bacterium]|nr:hypothetical protein [Myxococcales bacterium]
RSRGPFDCASLVPWEATLAVSGARAAVRALSRHLVCAAEPGLRAWMGSLDLSGTRRRGGLGLRHARRLLRFDGGREGARAALLDALRQGLRGLCGLLLA